MPDRPVLVAYASRHHGTEGIAREVATTLRADGLRVDFRRAQNVASVGRYMAVVVGSAVYMAQWEEAALALLRRERTALARRPVWLFSSGPVGDGKTTRRPETVPHPEVVAGLAEEIGVRGSAMFGGRVDTDETGFDMEVMAAAGLQGDWRDLSRVRAWSHAVAIAIRAEMDRLAAAAAEAAHEAVAATEAAAAAEAAHEAQAATGTADAVADAREAVAATESLV